MVFGEHKKGLIFFFLGGGVVSASRTSGGGLWVSNPSFASRFSWCDSGSHKSRVSKPGLFSVAHFLFKFTVCM